MFFFRFSLTFLFVRLSLIQNSFAVVLDCDFKEQITIWGREYCCVARGFRTTLNDRNVTEVRGTHVDRMTNNDVKKIFVKKQSCPYLPLNLASHFKNLETFYVMNSNVQHLLKGDLDGLTKLKVFDVSHNPIEQIGEDFFIGHQSIKIISFYDCHIKFVHPNALDPLVNLEEGHFQNNVCIDFHGTSANEIDNLKTKLLDKCQNYEKIFNNEKCLSVNEHFDSLSFTRRNAYLILSLFLIIISVLVLILVKIIRTRFDGDWIELKNVLL